MKELYTQIIAGKYRGKKLSLPSKQITRSTKNILKESFFNTIQFDIVDSIFFEVFGGSGSMGLEAISRGAKKAYFIEIDKNSFKVLQKNIKNIDDSLCEAYLGDSFELYDKILEKIVQPAFIYFDPPFDIRENMQNIYDKTISLIANTPKNRVKLITIEHISSKEFPKIIGEFEKKKSKKFGKSSLSYYIPLQ